MYFRVVIVIFTLSPFPSFNSHSPPLSLSSKDALDHLPSFLDLCKELSPAAMPAVVGTKADLYRNRKIATEDAVVRQLHIYLYISRYFIILHLFEIQFVMYI